MNMLGIPALVLFKSGEQRLNNTVVIHCLKFKIHNIRMIEQFQPYTARKNAMIYEILFDFCCFS